MGVPVAVTVPRAAVKDLGGLRRSDPVGGCAKGMPLKVSIEDPVEPTIVAAGYAMVTVGAPPRFSAGAARVRGRKPKNRENFMMEREIEASAFHCVAAR